MTVAEGRIEILKAAMIAETIELARTGIDINSISQEELHTLLAERLKAKQDAGFALPLFDWYKDVFHRNAG